jgi:CxxC-x17-CxxC domain-containing protein
MSFKDQDVRCVDCGLMFVFSAGEQQFFKEKGFTNVPKHCGQCKQKKNSGLRRRIETRIICSECAAPTTVPFKPSQGKPVLCRTCFTERKRSACEAAAVVVDIPPQ